MLAAIWQYGSEEVAPRAFRIAATGQCALAVGVGAASFTYGMHWPVAHMQVLDFATLTLAYASIVFGSSVAGMALVLTFPNDKFVSILMNAKLGQREDSAYSDLLFVFSWTAVVHWVLLVLTVAVLVVRGHSAEILNRWDGVEYRLLVSGSFTAAVYAVMQFLVTVITLAQVGRIYERETLRLKRDEVRSREGATRR